MRTTNLDAGVPGTSQTGWNQVRVTVAFPSTGKIGGSLSWNEQVRVLLSHPSGDLRENLGVSEIPRGQFKQRAEDSYYELEPAGIIK